MSGRITKYVKTADEIARMSEAMKVRRYDIERLAVDFETTSEYVRAILPPCFEPADKPLGSIRLSRALSAVGAEWSAAVVDVQCRYRDLVGSYCVMMLLTGDMPVTMGREFWGEIKKRAKIEFFRGDPYIYGYCERKGVKLIEVDGVLGRELGDKETSGHSFELKASIAADMDGLEYDPLVVVSEGKAHWSSVRDVDIEVVVQGTDWDPIDEVPIVRYLGAQYCVGATESMTVATHQEGPRDAYLPYVWGRNFDDPLIGRVPRRFRAQG